MLPAALCVCPVPVCDRQVHHELVRGPRTGINFPGFAERSGKSGSDKETPYRKECDALGLVQGRREFDGWLRRRPFEAPDSAHADGPRHGRRGQAPEYRARFAGHGIPRHQRIAFGAALAALGTGIRIFAIRHGIYKGNRPAGGEL